MSFEHFRPKLAAHSPKPEALGIEAASFWSVAEKDRAESPTAIAGTPKKTTDYGQRTTVTEYALINFVYLQEILKFHYK